MEVDNERDTEVIDELKDKIEKEHNLHPNYSEEQKQRQIEIDNETKNCSENNFNLNIIKTIDKK